MIPLGTRIILFFLAAGGLALGSYLLRDLIFGKMN